VRRSNEKPLKAAIEEFLKSYRLNDKLNEAKVLSSWEKVVGEMIARQTRRIYIKNKVLFVQVESAALRNELVYARTKIVIALNREVGATVIEEIILQ
jgi:predicted nucleic acid-binding Zn ribbon protein